MKDKEYTCPIFRALEKKGLHWNPETEEIESNRLWRAKEGETYFVVGYDGEVCTAKEVNFEKNDRSWYAGNYFSTEKEAQKYADEFKRMLKGRTLDKE